MATYSIKDLEKLSGIKAHTIRIWEQRHGLISPKRTDTNIRFYDDEQLKFLLNVSLLIKSGFKVSQISKWSEKEFCEQVSKVYEQSLIHDSKMHMELDANDIMTAMIDMDAQKFHRIYDNSIRQVGFKKTIMQLIYPFLEKVGVLWSISQINPAHEHFISCLIRQKIVAAIDRLPEPTGGTKFLLFLPESEQHEVGLLLAHYLLKASGANVFYLGQSLPFDTIETAILTVKPKYVLTFMVDPSIINNTLKVAYEIHKCCVETKLLIATRKTTETEEVDTPEIRFLYHVDELLEFV